MSLDGNPRWGAAATVRPGDVTKGVYTWADFMEEYGYGDQVPDLYPRETSGSSSGFLSRFRSSTPERFVPHGEDWDRVEFDPSAYLGFDPDELPSRLEAAAAKAAEYGAVLTDATGISLTSKQSYSWAQFKREYYFDEDGLPPRDVDGAVIPFDPSAYLGFDPVELPGILGDASQRGTGLKSLSDLRTVQVDPELDEDAFFSSPDGRPTLVNRYDLEKAVPVEKKPFFVEVERYWVNKPYAFVIVFHSQTENEKKYYVVEPHLNEIEHKVKEFISGKLRTAIKYSSDEVAVDGALDERAATIERLTYRMLNRYDLATKTAANSTLSRFKRLLAITAGEPDGPVTTEGVPLDPIRPEPAVLEENADTLTPAQVAKILYFLKRDFIGYGRIDAIKHDINVEDISCDGYNSPVFVYHSSYEQVITNVEHGKRELDNFVIKLAQRSGKGISKRQPQVDATLPDGSRAQLTLGWEVSGHGTNYTIRQFKDVPFTPVDLVNWHTFSLDEMAYLWLAIESKRSLIFAGGTASGKTTSLNAVSLFIPSNAKIVSIEDTREVELPQRNWVSAVTRPSFTQDGTGDIDEFDLLEAALRQRPDYIVMGEVRGEEGRTLFQVMSTGHTTLTTFHADSVGEVIKRFTTDPINVSKSMFTALDLVSVQTSTRVRGQKVRRTKAITEINHFDPENDEINVKDIFQWQAGADEYVSTGNSNTLEKLMFDLGWDRERLELELFKRKVVLAYIIANGLKEYAQVAATIQAFIADPDMVLALIASDRLERSLEDLRKMESVKIDIQPEKEALVPRPDPSEELYAYTQEILEDAAESLFPEYDDYEVTSLGDVFADAVAPTVIPLNPQLPASDDEVPALPDGTDVTSSAGDGAEAVGDGGVESDEETDGSPGDPAEPDSSPAKNADSDEGGR
ncbi:MULTISPECIES: type II/IV secretion system ATPase subunit [Haloferax]|uniref:Secretion system protein E n=1 Tax=Haloferax marinum TaxID=2666143 RepID=A0A6A8GBC2_9EURY|nr:MULTISPECIES: type II/IV secretion system ATPase subunit [Haloferax]KAB1191159.1 type II/IV secretion system ATPase subunit [Haloferax sp. CBA1150]MRW98045.1 secretion system protein E [Haloferax marinum]